MQSRDFCFWLQGLFELAGPLTLDARQTDLIKRHLNLVFVHEIDPSHSDDPKVQGALQAVHDGVDVNALRDLLEEKGFDALSPLSGLSDERRQEIEADIKWAQEIVNKEIDQSSGGGRGDIKYMC